MIFKVMQAKSPGLSVTRAQLKRQLRVQFYITTFCHCLIAGCFGTLPRARAHEVLGATGVGTDNEAYLTHRSSTFKTTGPGIDRTQTAGSAAIFTITAYDANGVRATSGGGDFIVEAHGPSVVRALVFDQLDGSYHARYSISRSGEYTLQIDALHQGGILVEYFDNIWFFYTPVLQRVERKVDQRWGQGLITPSAKHHVSVRWSGYLKATYSERTTFYLDIEPGAEGRLLVDRLTLIDCMRRHGEDSASSSHGAREQQSAREGREEEHEGAEGAGALARLLWASNSVRPQQLIPEENLFFTASATPLDGASHTSISLHVKPAPPSGRASSVHAGTPTVVTAGRRAVFAIQIRDAFGNPQLQEDGSSNRMHIAVRMQSRRREAGGAAGVAAATHEQGGVYAHEQGGGVYHVPWTPLEASAQRAALVGQAAACARLQSSHLHVHLLSQSGLSATYYAGQDSSQPLAAESNMETSSSSNSLGGDASALSASALRVPAASMPPEALRDALDRSGGLFLVRWSGYLLPTRAAAYSFAARVAGASHNMSLSPDLGVRVWVDEDLVLDEWNQSFAATSVVLAHAHAPYTIQVLLRDKSNLSNHSNLTLSLFWSIASSSSSSSEPLACGLLLDSSSGGECAVPAGALFAGDAIAGSPLPVLIAPAAVCAARSTVSTVYGVASELRGLSLATAGVASQLFVTARDAYDNRLWTARASQDEDHAYPASASFLSVRLAGVDSLSASVSPLTHRGWPEVSQDRSNNPASSESSSNPSTPLAVSESCSAPIDDSAGVFHVRYTPTKSGTYDVNIAFGSSLVAGAPIRVAVQPGPRRLASSLLSGAHLTLTTVGVASQITLTVRDQHLNWQPDPSIAEAGLSVALHEKTTGESISTTALPSLSTDLPYFHNAHTTGGASASAQGARVAQPTSLDSPVLRLRYVVTRSGRYSLQVVGAGLHEGSVSAGHFAIYVAPGTVCACQTSLSIDAKGLSAATAGQSVSFTIISRDQYGNVVSPDEGMPIYSVLLRASSYTDASSPAQSCPSELARDRGCAVGEWDANEDASVLDQVGLLSRDPAQVVRASVTGTRAGADSSVWVRLAQAGGLQATFYKAPSPVVSHSNSALQDCLNANDLVMERAQTNIGVTWQELVAINASITRGFAVRWQGLLRPSLAGVYTFKMGRGDGLYGGERVRLWLDNKLIIDQWTSLSNGPGLPTASAALRATSFHDIRVAWKEDLYSLATSHSNTSLQLLWRRPAHTLWEQIPLAMLMTAKHVSSSPHPLPILPGSLCAAQSCILGSSVSVATAGLPASFTMQGRDSYGNPRQLPADHGVKMIRFSIASNVSHSSAQNFEAACNVTYAQRGQYSVSCPVTEAGVHKIEGRALTEGGLYGEYFENSDLSDHGLRPNSSLASLLPPFVRKDRLIDFNWTKSERPCGPPAMINKDIGPDYFSARWKGMVQVRDTGVWTFYTTLPTGNDMKLLVNGLVVLSSSSSSSSAVGRDNKVAGTVGLMAELPYEVVLEYRRYTAAGSVQLLWQRPRKAFSDSLIELVPSEHLLTWNTIAGSCQQQMTSRTLTVKAGGACASTSMISGVAMSVSTVGVATAFVITSRDLASNSRTGPDDGTPGEPAFHVRFVPSVASGSQDVAVAPSGRKTLHAIPTRLSSEQQTGGLSATYYSVNSESQRAYPLWTADEHTVDFSVAASVSNRSRLYGQGGQRTGVYPLPSSGYSVRWAGSISVPYAGLYSFKAQQPSVSQPGDVVRMWIDGYLVLEGSGSRVCNGSIQLNRILPTTFPVILDYTSASWKGNHTGLQLFWTVPAVSSSNTSGLSPYELVPSSRLHPLNGRHGVVLLPTVSGTYERHVGLANIGGLDATFYSDLHMQHPAAFSSAQTPYLHQQMERNPNVLPAWIRNSLEKEGIESNDERLARETQDGQSWQWMSAKSFSIRWQGLLRAGQVFDENSAASSSQEAVFTFETAVARDSEERVRLWVDDQILIDGWDGLSLHTMPSGSASLRGGYYYHIRLEYSHRPDHRIAEASPGSGGHAYLELRWQSAQGAHGLRQTCASGIAAVIPSRCLYASRPILPAALYRINESKDILTVFPAHTCASVSSMELPTKWHAQAGNRVSFALRSLDAYSNRRFTGGDEWYVSLLPFPDWDKLEPLGTFSTSAHGRGSENCFMCSVERGDVEDSDDGLYHISLKALRAGSYKVLVDMLDPHGVSATYYAMNGHEIALPKFQRSHQQLDSLKDFASHCPVESTLGVLPSQVPDVPTILRPYKSCRGWLSGFASGGSPASILFSSASWSVESVNQIMKNSTDWIVLVINGTCEGQWRNLSSTSPSSFTSDALPSILSLRVSLSWSEHGGESPTGIFGEALQHGTKRTWHGCTAPDSTSYSTLIPRSAAPGSLSAGGPFATRWKGFVRTNSASANGAAAAAECLYSFNIHLSASSANQERVKMWLDNRLLVDEWSSLSAVQVGGTMMLKQDTLYNVHVTYKRADVGHYGARMMLRWSSSSAGDISVSCGAGSSVLAGIPSAHLKTGWRVMQDDSEGILRINAGVVSAAASIAVGSGLTESTSGLLSSFIVRARDAIGNRVLSHEDDWVVTMSSSGFADDVNVRGAVRADSSQAGDYLVEYNVTRATEYALSVKRALRGGLTATRYNNAHLLGEVSDVNISPSIDLQLAGAIPIDEVAASGNTLQDQVSVSWRGWFKAEYSQTYTFRLEAPLHDSVRLHVAGRLLVSRWHSLGKATVAPSLTDNLHDRDTITRMVSGTLFGGTFVCEEGQLYELSVDYRHIEGRASIKLMYGSFSVPLTVLPSERLFYSAQHIFGSPFVLNVLPHTTAASSSEAHGDGLSAMTAGVVATFSILARDALGNNGRAWSDTWVVYSSPSRSSPRLVSAVDLAVTSKPSEVSESSICSATGSSRRNVVAQVSAATTRGQYRVQMLQTQAGTSVLSIALAIPGSLMATYYDTSILSANKQQLDKIGEDPARSQIWEPLATREANLSVATVTNNAFSVRWSGFLRPSLSTTYTFAAVPITARDERVRLWMDGILLIDQWQSLAHDIGSYPSATFAFPRADGFYEFALDYQSTSSSPRAALMVAHSAGAASAIPSSKLFLSYSLSSVPMTIRLQPGPTDLEVSRVVGEAVSCSTAGKTSSFTLVCLDRYGNERGESLCGHDIHLRLTGGLGLAAAGSTESQDLVFESWHAQHHEDGGQPLAYFLTASGTYRMQLFMGSAAKSSTVYVSPGLTCAATTLVRGHCLSIATAGFGATFTIQSRDSFGNARTLNDDSFRVLLYEVGEQGERHDSRVVSNGQQPNTDLGRYSVSYRTSRSGTFALNVGVVSEGQGLMHSSCLSPALDLTGSLLARSSNLHAESTSVSENALSTAPCGPLNTAHWEGYISSRFSETYTFQAKLGSTDERMRLWVEDQWVIDEWTSLSSQTPSGTLWMARDVLVDLGLAFRQGASTSHLAAPSGLRLHWESASEARDVVHTDRLFSLSANMHVSGSPFHVNVFPARACGAVSTAVGTGLSVTTAGMPATMTIQARDHLGNPRGDAPYNSEVEGTAPVFAVLVREETGVRDEKGTVTSLASGLYRVQYVATSKRNKLTWPRSGTASAVSGSSTRSSPSVEEVAFPIAPLHHVSLVMAEQGGVQATYYNLPNFTIPSRARLAAGISMSVNGASALASGCVSASSAGFSARFSGMLRPPAPRRYTFTAALSGPYREERVRLWLDNLLIIDQWNSLSTAAPTAALQLGNAANSQHLYDLLLEFKGASNSSNVLASNMSLKMHTDSPFSQSASASSSAPATPTQIVSDYLFHSYPLSVRTSGGRGLSATYYSESANATSSFASGCAHGASHQCQAWGSARKAVTDESIDWSSSWPSQRGGPHADSVAQAGPFAARWTGFVSPSIQAVYTFVAHLYGAVGSPATSTERVSVWIDHQQVIAQWSSLDSHAPSGTIRLDSGDSLYRISVEYKTGSTTGQTRRGLSLLWQTRGLLAAGVHSDETQFSFLAFSKGGRRKVHDSSEVFLAAVGPEHWRLPQTGAEIERDDFISWDTDTYDDSQPDFMNSQVRRRDVWSVSGGCPGVAGSEAHDRCRGKGIASNDALRVQVNAGIICASKSSASGAALTIATAGVARTFALTARDAFDNVRDAADDSFVISALLDLAYVPAFAAIGGATRVQAHVLSQSYDDLVMQGESDNPPSDAAGRYKASYTATVSGIYNKKVHSVDSHEGNGLMAAYFPGKVFDYGEQLTRIDSEIDFNWGLAAPDSQVTAGGAAWGARWRGMLKPELTAVHTFFLETDGEASLQIAEHPVLSAADTGDVHVWSGTVALVASVVTEIQLEYKHSSGAARLHLRWQVAGMAIKAVPSSRLFATKQLIGNGISRLLVRPGVMSAAQSQMQGQGISLCTTGVPCTFAIIVRDAFGNLRDDADDMLLTSVVPTDLPERSVVQVVADQVNASFASSQGHPSEPGIHKKTPTVYDGTDAIFGDQKGNRHVFSYITTRAGSSMLFAVGVSPVRDVSGGIIRDVAVVSNGSGYQGSNVSANVSCSPPTCSGSGLSARCHIREGAVVGVEVLDAGNGYSSQHPPNVSCFGGSILAALRPTVAQASYLSAQGDGLFASFYDEPDFTGPPVVSQAGHVVDFSAPAMQAPSDLHDDVRWSGVVRGLGGGEHGGREEDTYTASLSSSDERVRIWVGHRLLIDQWASLQSLGPSGGAGASTQASLSAHRLLDIKVEYKKEPGLARAADWLSGAGLRLLRSKKSVSTEPLLIPRVHLFAAFPVAAATSAYDHGNTRPWLIRVEPNVACASKSVMFGSGLCIATAGITATFSIESRDAYDNRCLDSKYRYLVRVQRDECQSPADGRCEPYGSAIAASHVSSASSAAPIAPLSTLTSDLLSLNHSDSNCSLSSSLLKLPLPTSDALNSHPQAALYVGLGFRVEVGMYVILPSAGVCQGRWSQIIALDAARRCANISSRTSHATWADGLAACRDVAQGHVYIAAPASSANSAYPPMSCPLCQSSTHALVTDRGQGYSNVAFTATGRGVYSVFGSLVGEQGLTATYYNDSATIGSSVDLGAGQPIKLGFGDVIDWSETAQQTRPVPSLSHTGGFGVRWAGLISAQTLQTYTFSVSLHEASEVGAAHPSRVKLWLDNKLIIDQWSSLSEELPTGRVPLLPHTYYDLSLLYKCPSSTNTCGHTLRWKQRDEQLRSGTSGAVPLAALHRRSRIPTKLGQLIVAGGIACSSLVTASGRSLSLATAGRAASLTITSRDAFGNPRDSVEGYFIQLVGAEESPLYGGTSAPLAPLVGTSTGAFVAYEAKAYSLYINQAGGGAIKGSPFQLTVKADVACGTTSTMSGAGISAASLSPAVNTFRVQTRDAFGNQRTDLGASFEVFFVRVVRTRAPNVQGGEHGGLPPVSGSKALSDPGDVPTLHATLAPDVSAGDLAGSYSIPIVPSPAGQAHYLYASWMQPGGLHATYYSSQQNQALPVPCSKCSISHKFPTTVSSGGTSTNPATLDSGLVGPGSVCGSLSCNLWIRWAGGVRACEGSVHGDGTSDYTSCYGANDAYRRDFRWTMATADRVKLWVDSKLVIDQWSSLSVASPSASVVFHQPHRILDFFAEYQRLSTDVISSAPVLLSDTAQDGSFQPIQSHRLYRSEQLFGSPSFVNIYPT